MSVVAKFQLNACNELRQSFYAGSGSDGKSQYEITPGAKIEMMAVQSEPFGKSTPWGKIEANIFNVGATAFFADIWRRFVRDPDPRTTAPQFYVVFMTPAEYEVYANGGTDLSRAEREAATS